MMQFSSPIPLELDDKNLVKFFRGIIIVSNHPLELVGIMWLFHNTKGSFACVSFVFNKCIFRDQCPKELRVGRRNGFRISCGNDNASSFHKGLTGLLGKRNKVGSDSMQSD